MPELQLSIAPQVVRQSEPLRNWSGNFSSTAEANIKVENNGLVHTKIAVSARSTWLNM